MEKIKKWSEMTPRERWTHFLEYYKWHTAAVLAVLILIVYTLVECASNVDPDMTLLYAGPYPVGTEQQLAMEQAVAEYIQDYNGDGKVKASLMALYFEKDEESSADPQMFMAMQTKLVVELSSGEAQIFLLSEEKYAQLREQEIFSDLTGVFGELPGEDRNSVALSDTRLPELTGFGDLPGETRVTLIAKPVTEGSKNQEKLERYEQAAAFFRDYIVK